MMAFKLLLIVDWIFGCVFVIRNLRLIETNNPQREDLVTKIGSGAVIILTLAMFLPVISPPLRILFGFSLMYLLPTAARWWLRRNQNISDEELGLLIGRLILKVRAGRSIRSCLFELRGEVSQNQSKWLEKVQNVDFTEGFATDLGRYCARELREAISNPHQTILILDTLRRDVRTAYEFRRRSGQILAQVHAQAIVLTGLYFALLIFIVFGTNHRSWGLLALSMTLFVAGLSWILQIGRRIKWKL